LVAADIPILAYDVLGAAATAQTAAQNFATAADAVVTTAFQNADALRALINSPTFTGTVTAPNEIYTAAPPTVGVGQVGMGATTSTSANSGTLTPPAKYSGYLVINVGGTNFKLGYYPV
jgi:hypothetical protein